MQCRWRTGSPRPKKATAISADLGRTAAVIRTSDVEQYWTLIGGGGEMCLFSRNPLNTYNHDFASLRSEEPRY